MLRITLLIFVFLLRVSLFGQPVTVLFQEINIKDKIIQLEIAPEYQNKAFAIGLVKNDKLVANSEFLFASNQYFDIRDLKTTHSEIDYILINLPKEAILRQALVIPSLRQEFAILFSKSPFGQRSVNLILPKFFFGYRYTLVIFIGILILFLILLFAFKQSSLRAGLISLFVGFILMDLPTMNDQITVYRTIEKQYPLIDVVASTQQFVKEIKPLIQGETWRFHGKFTNEYQKLFLKYSLADIEYGLRGADKKIQKGTYLITQKKPRRNKKLVYEGNNFRLLIQQ